MINRNSEIWVRKVKQQLYREEIVALSFFFNWLIWKDCLLGLEIVCGKASSDNFHHFVLIDYNIEPLDIIEKLIMTRSLIVKMIIGGLMTSFWRWAINHVDLNSIWFYQVRSTPGLCSFHPTVPGIVAVDVRNDAVQKAALSPGAWHRNELPRGAGNGGGCTTALRQAAVGSPRVSPPAQVTASLVLVVCRWRHLPAHCAVDLLIHLMIQLFTPFC